MWEIPMDLPWENDLQMVVPFPYLPVILPEGKSNLNGDT